MDASALATRHRLSDLGEAVLCYLEWAEGSGKWVTAFWESVWYRWETLGNSDQS